MNAPRRYSAFISYSHRDARWAAWLQRSVERYRVPGRLVGTNGAHGPVPARPGPVFRDRDELAAGTALSDSVNAAMAVSDSLLVVCSPAATASRWVAEEIRLFQQLHPTAPILCLVVAGDPAADDEHASFPLPLRYTQDENGDPVGPRLEPLAADVRPGADGKGLARLKLLAGLLGVPLDALRQREQQRRQRVLAGVTAASLAGMAFTGWLAWSAMLAREDAERRQGQAEELVDFILSDLQDGLLKVGRLDIMQSAAQEARSYFSGLDVRDLTVEALQGHAESLRQLGDLQLRQGQPEEALKAFSDAYRMDEELLARAPDDTQRLFNLGQSEFWVGYAHLNMADNAAALERFNGYMDVSRRLYERDPQNVDWVMELCYAYNNLASVLAEEGRTAEAVANMREALRYNLIAIELAPEEGYLIEELAISEGWLAEVLRESGALAKALEQRASGQARWQSILAADPADADTRYQLAMVQMQHGDLLSMLGRPADARRELTASQQQLEQLLAVDPANVLWAQSLLSSSASIHLQDQTAESLAALRALLERYGPSLLADPPTDPAYRLVIARAYAATSAPLKPTPIPHPALARERSAALTLLSGFDEELVENVPLFARHAEVLALVLGSGRPVAAVEDTALDAPGPGQAGSGLSLAATRQAVAAVGPAPADPFALSRLVYFQLVHDPFAIDPGWLEALWSTGYRHPTLLANCGQLPSCP